MTSPGRTRFRKALKRFWVKIKPKKKPDPDEDWCYGASYMRAVRMGAVCRDRA
jgi:hypothetical protein